MKPEHGRRRRLRGATLTCLLAIALAARLFAAPAALGQEEQQEPEEAAPSQSLSKLAEEFTDPLTSLPQLFLQDAYTPNNYGTAAGTNRVIGRAIVPRVPRFSLLPFVQLVRPSISLVTVPTGRGAATRTELGDMQLFDLAVLPWPGRESGLLMGVGPTFTFPTATDKTAGLRAWQVGPAFGAIYKGIPGLILGALVQNPISFAYTSPSAQAQSTLLVQPIIAAYLGGGFYIKSADATWTMGWHQGAPTVIPVSLGLGYVLLHESWPPLNLFASGEWTAYRQFAPIAPTTTVRLGMTVAFPQFRPW